MNLEKIPVYPVYNNPFKEIPLLHQSKTHIIKQLIKTDINNTMMKISNITHNNTEINI